MPDKELVRKLRVLFLNKVKFSFDESTVWKSPAKHFLWAKMDRIFSFSVSFSTTSSGSESRLKKKDRMKKINPLKHCGALRAPKRIFQVCFYEMVHRV